MIYLILSVICGALFSVVFKICQEHNVNTQQVILFNYVTAAIVNMAPVAFSITISGDTQLGDYLLPIESYCLSALQGLFFVLGFTVMNISTWRNGVALTTISARASLILPVILSWLILSQSMPSWLSVILIVISMALLILPNEQQARSSSTYTTSGKTHKRKAAIALVGVFFFYGIADFSMKLVQQSVASTFDDAQLISYKLTALTALIFIMASIISLITCVFSGCFKTNPVNWRSILGGIILGAINLGCTSGMVRALNEMSTSLFYPLYNIGIVLIATIVGASFFKEKIKWLQLIGVVMAIVAIALFFI
ncbi:MAG: hypothetical protein MJZ20_08880 [Bacteroidaceae bacterium]|nr:hypothetical protein [Bacteroidaceae bacterium]